MTIAKVIKRYRLHKSKRDELKSLVKVQRTIFRKAIWRLLAYDVGLGEDTASQVNFSSLVIIDKSFDLYQSCLSK